MRVADVDAARWSANPHVAGAGDEYTALAGGLYARKLKLPVTADGCMCLERHRLYAAGKYREVDLPAVTEGLARMRGGVVFMGVRSHWHFLMDGLGQLQPRAMGDGRETLYLDGEISTEQERFTLAFARAAGFAPFTNVERIGGDWLAVDDCAFPCRRLITHQVAWLRTVMRVRPEADAGRRLFVARTGAAIRRLLNQDEVAAALRGRLGFELVDPAALTLEEQVEAFRGASVIVGPHGAGLANAVFAARPRLLVEFCHTQPQLFYHSLAFALGASHYTIDAAPVAGQHGHNADYTVDARRAAEILAILIARHP
jgi:glycosyl transferase family 61